MEKDNYRRDVLEHTVINSKWVLVTLECGHAVKHRIKNLKHPVPKRKVCVECQLEDDGLAHGMVVSSRDA